MSHSCHLQVGCWSIWMRNREAIEKLLLDFPSYFENNANQGFALGPALKAGHKMISNIGGKLVCFAATLPNMVKVS